MRAFDYYAPHSLPEAIDLLARHGGEARAIAGGTDLLLKLKTNSAAPSAVVNIKRLGELRGLTLNGQLSLGALTTLEDVRRSAALRQHCPALPETAARMASVQIRNLATVGGNLCSAAPSADLAPILIALGATARIAGSGGERRVPLDEFFLGPGRTVLAPDELLLGVDLPLPAGAAIYLKHSPRDQMDIAVVGVGLRLQDFDSTTRRCAAARVALGAVAPAPMRAQQAEAELCAGALTPERIERAAELAAEAARPIDDVRGSAWYRRRMVAVLVRRGLNHLVEAPARRGTD